MRCPQLRRRANASGVPTAATVARDVVIGAGAGFFASKVMSPVTSKLYELESDEAKEQEGKASFGVAYEVAAKKTAQAVGVELDDRQAAKVGMALHYGLGLGWAPVYMWLRRSRGLGPLSAGVVAGTSMYVVVDEVVNPVFRFTPGPTAYPLVTHVRGLLGHLVYGVALAVGVEAGWSLFGGKARR